MKKFMLHILFTMCLFVMICATSAHAVQYDPENEQQVYEYLSEVMGLNDAVVAGIMANIEHESYFDPRAGVLDVNGKTSYGICQWNGGRLTNMLAFCTERNLDYNSLDGQLPYLQYELENNEKYAYGKIKDVEDTAEGAYQAGYNWAKYFERCAQFWNGKDQYDARGILAEEKYWAIQAFDELAVRIDFDANGGSCGREFKRVRIGEPIGRLPVPKRDGYDFLGWYNFNDREITQSSIFTANETVTARWQEREQTEEPLRFTDVQEGIYYYMPVMWAVEHGITQGTGEGRFSPDGTTTRGQIVTFLWRAQGSPEPKSQVNRFGDVSTDAYYYKAVMWAVENGITNGLTATTFGPEEPCTREQTATFLWRAKGSPIISALYNPFGDVSEGDYYYNAVIWAVSTNVTNGVSDNSFGSGEKCTRAHVVTFLYRAFSA